MSILLLSEIFPPSHGGSGRWFYELYRRLIPGTVTIVTNDNNRPEDKDIDKQFPQQIHRIAMTSRSWGVLSPVGLGFYARTILKILKRKPKNLTQIHCGRVIPEGFTGLLLARLLHKPLLCFVHGEDIEIARTSRELAWIVRRVLRGATKLICNSQNTKSLLIEHWGVPAHKIEVINPGVDEERFRPAPPDPDFRAKYGWTDKFVCLTVGRLQRRKGHDRMIEAITLLRPEIPNLRYVIVGQGDNRENLRRQVETSNLADHVQFLDEIDDRDLIRCYQQCDIFILPNRADGNDIEGFGMVLVEAQAVGKPVIAGNSGGTAETMDIGTTGLIVECTEAEKIAEAVLFMREGIIMKSPFQPEACRQYVLENFTWREHVRKALAVFEKNGGMF